jgi:alkylhydroperoxidase family enzyme
MVDPLFLPEVLAASRREPAGYPIREMEGAGLPVPGIMRLLAFKPAMTAHLNQLTQAVMRGPSPLPAGMRELIAAFTSRGNQCVF